MRRFFRSAAFPILIVIVLAFFAQRLINNPSTGADADPEPVPRRRSSSDPRSFDEVTFQQKTNTIDVKQQDGKELLDRLPEQLRADS